MEGSKWTTEEENPTIFRLAGSAAEKHWLFYDTTRGNDFRTTYAYDEVMDYRFMPYCSDLMVRFCVSISEPQGQVGVTLSKYGTTYVGQVDFSGKMSISQLSDKAQGGENLLTSKSIDSPSIDKPIMLRFANVDHTLVLEFGNERIKYDLGRGPNDAGARKTGIEPQARIFGAGKLEITHLALFRDIHYTASNPSSSEPGRATEGNPLKLEADQFFMLGDNSPRSEDGRWWANPGKGNNGKIYTRGIVPREYLVGKALFVYWPAGFRPFVKSPVALIPNVGELRFTYGGSYNLE
jgi:hypothetical protein